MCARAGGPSLRDVEPGTGLVRGGPAVRCRLFLWWIRRRKGVGFQLVSNKTYTGARARARDPYFARLAPGGRGPTPCAPQGGAAKVRCYFLMLFFSLTPGTRCCSTPGTRKFVVEVLAVFATRANLYLEAPHLESHYLSAQDVVVPSRRHNETGSRHQKLNL